MALVLQLRIYPGLIPLIVPYINSYIFIQSHVGSYVFPANVLRLLRNIQSMAPVASAITRVLVTGFGVRIFHPTYPLSPSCTDS